MIKRQRVVRLRFWHQWVLANAIGVAVGLLVLLAVGGDVNDNLRYAVNDPERYVTNDFVRNALTEPVRNALSETRYAIGGAIGGAFGGAVLGFAQWLVLRKQILRIRWWIPATIVGGAVGGGFGAVVGLNFEGTVDYIPLVAVVGAVLAAALGVAQWLVLRRQIRRPGWWVLATILGGAVVGAAYLALVYVVSFAFGGLGEFVREIVAIVFLTMGGAIFGLITAPVIIWQLRKSTV